MQRILIAEDDRELRQLFTRVLQKNGYSVTGVGNGQEGLAAIRTGYDLVISDVMMPVMNGFEMIREIRKAGNPVPVLVITAKDAFDEMRQGFLCGKFDYLIKPISLHDLLEHVKTLLTRGRAQRSNTLVMGGTVLESDSRSVTAEGKSQVLPEREFSMLYQMAMRPGHLFTFQQLAQGAADSGTEKQLEQLREQFRDNRDFSIVTMRGVGCRLRPAAGGGRKE